MTAPYRRDCVCTITVSPTPDLMRPLIDGDTFEASKISNLNHFITQAIVFRAVCGKVRRF